MTHNDDDDDVKLPIKKTMENEDTTTFHLGRIFRPSQRAFTVELSQKTGVASGISLFLGNFDMFR